MEDIYTEDDKDNFKIIEFITRTCKPKELILSGNEVNLSRMFPQFASHFIPWFFQFFRGQEAKSKLYNSPFHIGVGFSTHYDSRTLILYNDSIFDIIKAENIFINEARKFKKRSGKNNDNNSNTDSSGGFTSSSLRNDVVISPINTDISTITESSGLCLLCDDTHKVKRKGFDFYSKEYQERVIKNSLSSVNDVIEKLTGATNGIDRIAAYVNKSSSSSSDNRDIELINLANSPVIQQLVQTYKDVPSGNTEYLRTLRLKALSNFAHFFPLEILNQDAIKDSDYFISKSMKTNAQNYAANYGHGGEMTDKKRIVRNSLEVNADRFRISATMQFAFSCIDHTAYGTKLVKFDDGESVEVPQRRLILTIEQAHTDYLILMESEELEPLPKSIFIEILHSLADSASNKMLAALDSVYCKSGIDNFTKIRYYVNVVCCNNEVLRLKMLSRVDSVEKYLHYDITKHLCKTSKCRSHNLQFLFGELKESDFPDEQYHCNECDQIELLKHDLIYITQNVVLHKKYKVNNKVNLLKYLEEDLFASLKIYLAHIIRKSVEASSDNFAFDNMTSNQVFIILDWKMKLLSQKKRESMEEFFGKRGLAWFGGMFLRLKTQNEIEIEERVEGKYYSDFVVNFYDISMQESKEDAFAVSSILEGIINDYKRLNRHIDECIIKSDNAGCFGSEETLRFFGQLYEITGVKCVLCSISEAGCGKSWLDGHFSYVYKILKVFIALGGYDVNDATDVPRVLSMKSPGNCYTGVSILKLSNKVEFKKNQIVSLTNYMQRKFIYDSMNKLTRIDLYFISYRVNVLPALSISAKQLYIESVPSSTGANIRFYRNGSIYYEQGLTLPNEDDVFVPSKLQVACSTRDRENKNNIILNKIETKKRKREEQIINKEEEKAKHKDEVRQRGYFKCSVITCNATFKKEKHFENHINAGVHECIKQTTSDQMKRLAIASVVDPTMRFNATKSIAALQEQMENSLSITNSYKGVDNKFINILHVGSGYAVKNTQEKQKQYSTHAALQFVLAMQELGDSNIVGPNVTKTLPRTAERAMILCGTKEGEDLFPHVKFMKANQTDSCKFELLHLLDAPKLKIYFGNSREKLENKISNRKALEDKQKERNKIVVTTTIKGRGKNKRK